MCLHGSCKDFDRKRRGRGVGVLYVVRYCKVINGKKVAGDYALVGKKESGQHDVIGGYTESKCWVEEGIRETLEEAKVDIRPNFDAEFRNPANNFIRWIFVGKTPVLVGVAPRGFSRGPLNQLIAAANADKSLPSCQRELECVEFAQLGADGLVRNPEGGVLNASDYLRSALAELQTCRAALGL